MTSDTSLWRRRAVNNTLFPATELSTALSTLGFVQADPIRAPARAQDLTLRHRVTDYHVDDLEKSFRALELEEDILYAYGFLTRPLQQLLYPRPPSALTDFEQRVLAAVQEKGEVHPAALEARFGKERVVNDWGGYSKATKRALESLHFQGLLRVARREKGIRVYGVSQLQQSPLLDPNVRLRLLVLQVAQILAPVSDRNLQEAVRFLRRTIGDTKKAVVELVKTGELEVHEMSGIKYYWPAAVRKQDNEFASTVRFLAPFDPLVWDRRRFEQFWGWQYRFEAYTPAAKRIRGYYALPVLWCEEIVGWVNLLKTENGVSAELGYVQESPKDPLFQSELAQEIQRVTEFLQTTKP